MRFRVGNHDTKSWHAKPSWSTSSTWLHLGHVLMEGAQIPKPYFREQQHHGLHKAKRRTPEQLRNVLVRVRNPARVSASKSAHPWASYELGKAINLLLLSTVCGPSGPSPPRPPSSQLFFRPILLETFSLFVQAMI